jgi:hypothetical protein
MVGFSRRKNWFLGATQNDLFNPPEKVVEIYTIGFTKRTASEFFETLSERALSALLTCA